MRALFERFWRLAKGFGIDRCHTFRLLLLHQMAPAIYGRKMTPSQQIIVFAQHAPGPKYLEPKLRHLAENGYETVTTREYADWLAGRWMPRRPTVMLTFDDGLKTFVRQTLPVLKRYGFRSVLFVCPGLTDLATRANDSVSRLARKTILTWDELRCLSDTGFVDIQSHGMWHNWVQSGSSPITTSVVRIDHILQYAELLPPDGRLERVLDGRGYEVCRYPGTPFFMCNASQKAPLTYIDHIRDLAESKQMIEQNLPGHRVRAFAFPWWKGSISAIRAVRPAGYELAFWGLGGVGPRLGRQAVDPLRVGRLGFDWILCLPGRGRTSVTRLLWEKYKGLHDDSL